MTGVGAPTHVRGGTEKTRLRLRQRRTPYVTQATLQLAPGSGAGPRVRAAGRARTSGPVPSAGPVCCSVPWGQGWRAGWLSVTLSPRGGGGPAEGRPEAQVSVVPWGVGGGVRGLGRGSAAGRGQTGRLWPLASGRWPGAVSEVTAVSAPGQSPSGPCGQDLDRTRWVRLARGCVCAGKPAWWAAAPEPGWAVF